MAAWECRADYRALERNTTAGVGWRRSVRRNFQRGEGRPWRERNQRRKGRIPSRLAMASHP